jgi:two-component system, NtrC family, response regulator AtoC
MPANLTQSLRIDSAELPGEAVIFGCTAAMGEIRNTIDQVGTSDLPILIQGENGTGKEVIARYIHSHSKRGDTPFVKLNCAAVPTSLLESELFGYEKGSFTGARDDRPGLIEIAGGGTLFLDEIGEMHRSLQGKLLQLLHDGSYTRIGSGTERVGQIRLICASNMDLKQAVETGTFRQDLFYRIDVVNLRLPALRERKNDIPQLCDYFLQKLARKFGRKALELNPATQRLVMQWGWPGNLRELENWIARGVILGEFETVATELRRKLAFTGGFESREMRSSALKEASRRAASAATSAVILKVLQANRWNRRKTAEDLNMSYRSLLYKLREAGISQRRRGHRGIPPSAF